MAGSNLSDGNSPGKSAESKLNRQMLGKLIVIAVLMFGFGYALVPLYKKLCEITNINFLTPKDSSIVAPVNSQIDKTRTITVEFDGNSQGPWRFRPAVSSMQVHPGEMKQVLYEVVNKQSRTMEAQAIPSYMPQRAEEYFKKVECFCFTQQTLAPNQAKEFPVVFFVDPAIPKDIKEITLSYTFFEITKPSIANPVKGI
ncbi:cytochrome c oxidase assembly protein [Glaciimonas soli]|uniref:Cytochrome c oxidase assembly protein CtaG n=1 Tax=Glaciimonas soli TaxID=2590999 RepID=A0A843YSC3_9BURK|nr:cytochrome c oxidase assembly protein [Glaciimonas soli]MQR00408.1 cytochrome c oxidase assembly protein [Glaciimonas soli]